MTNETACERPTHPGGGLASYVLLVSMLGCAGGSPKYASMGQPPMADAPMAEAAMAPKPTPSEPPAPEAVQPGTTLYLSADDSNSAASPVVVRKSIQDGRYVQPELIRTYEFLNYYSFDYPAPDQEPIRLVAEMRPTKKQGEYSLQVGLRSRDRRREDMPPLSVTLLLDTSGSMAGRPMELQRVFVSHFMTRLKKGDQLSIVTCDRTARVLLDGHQIGPDSSANVEALLASLRPNDITDLEKGVVTAYQVAVRNRMQGGQSRVILLSDGADNTGKKALEAIARHAEDNDREGIYLAAIGLGKGDGDRLMDAFTDRGRGAYRFVDHGGEILRILDGPAFAANFDLAVKDVRLRMHMPPGVRMVAFHGEQVSTRAADIVPQYLSPNDQMIYHLEVASDTPVEKLREQTFEFEAEFTEIGGRPAKARQRVSVANMLSGRAIVKGDALVAYAEALKKIGKPLSDHRQQNLKILDAALKEVAEAARELQDAELQNEVLPLMKEYRRILDQGEQHKGSRDDEDLSIPAVLGIAPAAVRSVKLMGSDTTKAIRVLTRLLSSNRLVPQEGYRFVALGSGPIGNPNPSGRGQLSSKQHKHPMPAFMGALPSRPRRGKVLDLHQIQLELTAPPDARSFSVDFNYFSAEYPDYVKKNYNDTFYAILQAPSTNGGRPTNIAFDANNQSIEVDNNYFQQPFHPVPNTGTGFDRHGSTGWLRTSWPIKGGEKFTLTFSIHDEGDAVFDSVAILDNFQWHSHEAVGTTDPLN